jgi:hypothetical protein
MQTKIIENVIPLNIQNDIEKAILDVRFPWHFIPSSDISNLVYEDYLKAKQDLYQDCHIVDPPQFFQNILTDHGEPSFFFGWFAPILDQIKFEGMRILRMKINMTFPYAGTTALSYGIPHVDLPDEPAYTTGIYYVTDADGDTLLFNEKHGHQGRLSIQSRINPKKGKLVLFEGNTLHAPTPTFSNKVRIVLNINFK